MGTWRWFSLAYCEAKSSCVLVDAWLQLFLCLAASLFFVAACCLAPRRHSDGSSRRLWTSLAPSRSASSSRGPRFFAFFSKSGSGSSKTAPMPLAVIQKDADEAHITSHKNSLKQASEFMRQTQRISRVDFATKDKDARTSEPRRPSRTQSFIDRLGSFSRRRDSKSSQQDQPSDREALERRHSHSVGTKEPNDRIPIRKRSNPLPLASSSSRRGSLTVSSVEVEQASKARDTSKTQSGPRQLERSASFRQLIAARFYPSFIRAIKPTAHPNEKRTHRERSATTFDVPSYSKREKLAALSPEHRKKKERRGSVELRDKRRLSIGREAQIRFEVSDGNEASVYEVKLTEITLVKRLAFGPLSEVYAAIWRDTKVGVKLLMPREGVTDKLEEAVKNFRREIWVMNALKHPNIVKLIGASLTPTCYVLVMEYMSNGSLYEYLRDEANFFPNQMVLTSALDIADGMRHIHACTVLQRDLKSKNCLVSENLVVKVADFGLSRFKTRAPGEQQYTFVGTPFWAAPEVIRHEPYDEKADVYSYAIVLWELVERRDPYESINPFQVPLQVANEGLRPNDFSKPAPLGLEQLIKQCWDADPDQRPTFDEIVETLQKWLPPTTGSQETEAEGDLAVHVQRERHSANERELNRFASSHDANAKAIPIVLSRGQTERLASSRSQRHSLITMMPPKLPPRPQSDRSISRGSNHSAP